MSIRPATPKQIAYLSYMGVHGVERMDINEASDAIQTMFDIEDLDRLEKLRERQHDWVTDRFILYPVLYEHEIESMLKNELPDVFHSFVRNHVVGASEKLTKQKISKIISSLTAENAQWWQAKNKKDVFFAKLASTFPGCVDGHQPVKKVTSAKRAVPSKVAKDSRRPFCRRLLAKGASLYQLKTTK